MNDQDKTMDKLIIELQKLKQEIFDLKAYNTEIISKKRGEDLLLHQTRLNFETFFNSINDFLFVLDLEGNIIYTNSTVLNRLGYKKKELYGLSVLKVHAVDKQDEAFNIGEEMLNGITEFCSIPIVTKSGVQIPVETRITQGVWDGEPAVFRVSKDISKIKLSEEKFSKVFYLNPSVCGLTEIDSGKYIEVNDKFFTILGFQKEEVIGKTVSELGIITPEAYKAVISKADKNGKISNIKADLKAKNGEIKHVLLSSENIYVQNNKYRFTVVNDITELKKAEEEINRQAGMISSLLDSIPDLIFIKDIHGVYLGCNPPFAEFVGKPRNEITGKTDHELFDKEVADFFRKFDKSMLEVCKSQRNEEWITYPDGRKRLIDTLKTPYWGQDGTLTGIIGISRDITERKLAEDEIKLKNKELVKINAEKDKFFSIIAHDLRSPFNGFLGLTEEMVMDLPNLTMNQIQKFAVTIRTSATNLYRLLNNLLEWTQAQKGTISFSPNNLNLLVLADECLILVKESAKMKEIDLVLDIPEKLEIFADKNMIQTVIRNFVSNAVKFTHKGGNVSLTAKKNSNNEIEVSISDTGIGMSAQMIEDLFRIDVQNVRKGTEGELSTGLGLQLCKEFVEKHNGTIWVESSEGIGTTFSFTLPSKETIISYQ
ncbi:MAG: hypothetical protein CVU02_00780 [Bacteroidetes bacterium HGW-Bacteroidetes-19]|nr:MAG: hypothetical protein CVU04_00045 [Bacteroidetes bacterium HGW-Bacteroidetes-20]PKP28477.1 MAG: hypothetical protein CVU02_00780 [Bacteroidetes bacterium HGW-Bacteroidetes-19]